MSRRVCRRMSSNRCWSLTRRRGSAPCGSSRSAAQKGDSAPFPPFADLASVPCLFLFTGLPLQHLRRQRTRQFEKLALGVHLFLGCFLVPGHGQLEHTRRRLVKLAV